MGTNKQRNWDETSKKFQGAVDGIGLEIDKGIFEAVVCLNVMGFPTTGSCEGHVNWGVCAPWVDVGIKNKEMDEKLMKAWKKAQEYEKKNGYSKRIEQLYNKYHQIRIEKSKPAHKLFWKLVGYLDEFYKAKEIAFDQRLILSCYSDSCRLESQGAESQEAAPSSARKVRLRKYKQEMADFTSFLKKKYFGE